ncbi:hypothetical protein BVRB_9g225320 isoform A [Beta vulgaris subsp. vulgaris]|uniref:Uncharacterized protein n=1 Tax=Beta vulgaris subsp. vulgaris TaxID=3555 RepID=A0A0J8B997_BETVV|nr:hypothetical protein BVRB_9g225320 isoform A [Beta vulgaris subsp. vulgaris]
MAVGILSLASRCCCSASTEHPGSFAEASRALCSLVLRCSYEQSTKMSRFGGRTCLNHDVTRNEYEQQRMKTIEANKIKMHTLSIKRIATSMTSLVDSSKAKKRQQKCDATLEKDGDYAPDENEENDYEEDAHILTTNKKMMMRRRRRRMMMMIDDVDKEW